MWYKKPLSAYHFTVFKMGSDNDIDSNSLQNQKVNCRDTLKTDIYIIL
jgi:hypothetical protein